jgi:O-antigen/teichoic acid export membrane protein
MATARLYAALTIVPAAVIAIILHSTLFVQLSTTETIAFYISMLCLPLSVSWATDVSVLITTKEFRRMAILGLVQSGIYFVIVLLAWLAGLLTVAGVVYAQLAGNAATFLLGISWVSSRHGRIRSFGSLLREGLSLAGGQLADVATRRLDQVVALPLLGAAGAGLYSVAATIGSLPTPIAHAVGASAFNDLVQATPEQKEAVVRTIRHSVFFGVLSAIALTIASLFLISIVFGEDFVGATPAAVILSIGSLFLTVGFNASMALAAQKRGAELTIIQVLGVVLGLVLFIPLGIWWGPTGAAVAMALSSCVTMIVLLRRLKISIVEVLPRRSDVSDAMRTLLHGRTDDPRSP